MNELIGVTTYNGEEDWKRYALIYDRLCMFRWITLEPEGIPEVIGEYDRFLDSGYAVTSDDVEHDNLDDLANRVVQAIQCSISIRFRDRTMPWSLLQPLLYELFARGLAIELNRVMCNVEAVPLEQTFPKTRGIEQFGFDRHYLSAAKTQHNAARIVLKSLPIPTGENSWDKLVDFRRDSDTKTKLSRLRQWMFKISRQDLKPNEIEQELEWAVRDYTEHMKVHELKVTTGTVETVVTATAEVLENVMKFNFSKAAKAMFALKKRKVQLMEAELNAPGRELAYVVKARKELGDGKQRR